MTANKTTGMLAAIVRFFSGEMAKNAEIKPIIK